jgi:hypothetical protein
MKTIVEIVLPDGSKQRVRVSAALAKSKAGQRAFASGSIGGAPYLSSEDIQTFDATRAERSALIESKKVKN